MTLHPWSYFNRPKKQSDSIDKLIEKIKEASVKITIEDLRKFSQIWIEYYLQTFEDDYDAARAKRDTLSQANLVLLDILNRKEPKPSPNLELQKYYYVKIQDSPTYRLMTTERNSRPEYIFLRDMNTRIAYSVDRVTEIRGPVTITENIEELPKLWG